MQAGDTLSSIADAFGLMSNTAVPASEWLTQSNKPDIVDSDDIFSGQRLRIPSTAGLIHTVFSSETLADLAMQYGVTQESIITLKVNQLESGSQLRIGRELIVPNPVSLPPATSEEADALSPLVADTPAAGPVRATPKATAAATETPELTPPATATSSPEPTREHSATPDLRLTAEPHTPSPTTTPPPSITPTPSRKATSIPDVTATATPRRAESPPVWIWPAEGPVSSHFGPAHPLGIDIDLYGNSTPLVVASAPGIVPFVGGNPCCSYGFYVVIDHGNGFATLYAHLAAIAVREGDEVEQGQLLALGGETGASTGVHLHFEIRKQGKVVDPLKYLPRP